MHMHITPLRILTGFVLSLASMITALIVTTPSASATTATCRYWTTDEGVSALIVTSGVNCSKTASFTIAATPYGGATFVPDSGQSAFGNYLGQIGEFIHGPGNAPKTALSGKLVISNAYTNHVEVKLYRGPGDRNDRAYEALKALLTTGSIFG